MEWFAIYLPIYIHINEPSCKSMVYNWVALTEVKIIDFKIVNSLVFNTRAHLGDLGDILYIDKQLN